MAHYNVDEALARVQYAAEAIARRKITSLQLVDAGIQRYRNTEPTIHAFARVDIDHIRRVAQQRDRDRGSGQLHGVPIGVKDVFDMAGVPTEYGSEIFSGRVPARSSAVANSLDEAGAVVFGKTVTAELAYYAPGPTRNPHNPRHTPGGSSQGSAAAVAAGVVPGAVGTQTNGSIIRPAAYCGVVGFKPSSGTISTRGALRFAPTLDQVGVFARTVGDAALLARVLGSNAPSEPSLERPPVLAIVRTADWQAADHCMRDRFEEVVALLQEHGASTKSYRLPRNLELAPSLISTVMAYEAARSLGPEVLAHRQLASDQLLSLLDRGANTPASEYLACLDIRRRLIGWFEQWAERFDAIVTIPASGEAPVARSTGDPRWCSRWTYLGAPAMSLPAGTGPTGLPLGIQLVAGTGADGQLVRVGAWVELVLETRRAALGH